ncbi:MAG TPA: phytanoyl-CoA dioxygenase family protein [Vicinamibacterales bacterium]|nr:phytanoyl-CoA dioxygenase family protein [Vicinamibacterales bacterium]
MALSSDEMRAFERDGFVIVRGVFGASEIAGFIRAIEALSNRPPEIGRQMVYFENSQTTPATQVLSRIEAFVDYDETLSRVVFDPRIVETASALLGDGAVLFKDKINFKLPGGSGFTPHQDIQAGWDTYAPYFVSVLLAIDANTVANGCLELAAGHHGRGLIGRRWEPLDGTELNGLEFVPYPMAAGDAAFFDCFTPHRSQPNLTDRPRRNLYLTFNRAADGDFRKQYFADKRKSFPPDYERTPGVTYTFRV